MDPELRAEVVVHALYNKTPGAHNSAATIYKIVDMLLSGGSTDFDAIADDDTALTAFRQTSEHLYVANSMFLELWARCQEVGSMLTEWQACNYYVRCLAVGIFKKYKVDYVPLGPTPSLAQQTSTR